jgi:hypothetical protein
LQVGDTVGSADHGADGSPRISWRIGRIVR